jgi:hypothetical protein
MDIEKIEAVEKVQAELINLQRPPALDMGIFTLEASEGSRQPNEMVAVGYGLTQEGTMTIQLRVDMDSGSALEQAEELVAEAERKGYQTNLLRLERATVPTIGEVKATIPDHRMIRPNRRPHLGVSVSHLSGVPGSLGAFVYFNNKLAILSASHVLAMSGHANKSDKVHRPGVGDADPLGPGTIIATLEDFTILTSTVANTIDAAIAVVNPDYKLYPKSNHNLIPPDLANCPVRGQKLSQEYDGRHVVLGTRIGKIGRTTGYTEGVVTAVGLAHLAVSNPSVKSQRIAFKNLIEITWDDDKPFSAPGDSGAIYFTLDPLRAFAMHIVGGKREDGACVSYGCNLLPALGHFGCKLSPN